jgi:hypothetical protein
VDSGIDDRRLLLLLSGQFLQIGISAHLGKGPRVGQRLNSVNGNSGSSLARLLCSFVWSLGAFYREAGELLKRKTDDGKRAWSLKATSGGSWGQAAS